MNKTQKKNDNNKNSTKKGGFLGFKSTQKYKILKQKKMELEQEAESLREKIAECKEKYFGSHVRRAELQFKKGGMFGLTRSSKYNDLKKQITKLEEEIIPKLKEELAECESGQLSIEEEIGNDKVGKDHVVGSLRQQKWENKMKGVYEKGARQTAEYEAMAHAKKENAIHEQEENARGAFERSELRRAARDGGLPKIAVHPNTPIKQKYWPTSARGGRRKKSRSKKSRSKKSRSKKSRSKK